MGLKRTTKRKVKRKHTKPIKILKKKLWTLCREIIRKRYFLNGGWRCFTCGNTISEPHSAQTGHFIPSSVCSTELRYSLENLKIQCFRCNINLSGNWPAYHDNLIRDHGIDYVHSLLKRNQETKGKQYDTPWYENKIKEYESHLQTLR